MNAMYKVLIIHTGLHTSIPMPAPKNCSPHGTQLTGYGAITSPTQKRAPPCGELTLPQFALRFSKIKHSFHSTRFPKRNSFSGSTGYASYSRANLLLHRPTNYFLHPCFQHACHHNLHWARKRVYSKKNQRFVSSFLRELRATKPASCASSPLLKRERNPGFKNQNETQPQGGAWELQQNQHQTFHDAEQPAPCENLLKPPPCFQQQTPHGHAQFRRVAV